MTAGISPGTAASSPASPGRAARFAGLARYQGHPVPAITLWSGRTVPVFRPGEGWVWDCECLPGRGTPQLGSVCPARQRQVMTGRCCQMCGQPVTGEPFWITGTERSEWLRDPPFHATCGRYALAACPGLQLPLRDPASPLRIIGCDDYDIAFTTEDGDDYYTTAGAAAAASGQRNLVKWAWARPAGTRTVYTLAEWAQATSPRARHPGGSPRPVTATAGPGRRPPGHGHSGSRAVPGRSRSALPPGTPRDDQRAPAAITAHPGGLPRPAPTFTRIWRAPDGLHRAAGPVDAASTAAMREWIAARNRAAIELAPPPDDRGISVSRARAWIRGLGLTARPCVIASRNALQQYRRDLAAAGYGIPALNRLLDRGDLGAVYSQEVRLVIVCRNGEPGGYLENVLVHELAHGTEDLQQEWTAEQMPGPGPGPFWNVEILRSGFNVVSVRGTETGALLEEGFAELLAAEYARDVLGGAGLLPARDVPPHLTAITGHVWETGPGTWTYSRSAPAAAAVKLLTRVRPELRDALIHARTSPSALTDIARIINSIRPGLYRQLRTYGHSTFQDGYEHARSAVRNHAAAAP